MVLDVSHNHRVLTYAVALTLTNSARAAAATATAVFVPPDASCPSAGKTFALAIPLLTTTMCRPMLSAVSCGSLTLSAAVAHTVITLTSALSWRALVCPPVANAVIPVSTLSAAALENLIAPSTIWRLDAELAVGIAVLRVPSAAMSTHVVSLALSCFKSKNDDPLLTVR